MGLSISKRSKMATRQDLLSENVFLFIPNLIGYARIILTFVSFYFMMDDPIAATIAYAMSALLDAFDGAAARYFNQSSRMGAMLDQLTDRCTTMGLTAVLSALYPDYSFLFLTSMTIDISSHWAHVWSTLIQGKTTHKLTDPCENPILRIYYSSRPILFTLCAGNEVFFGSLYLMNFYEGFTIPINGQDVGLIRLAVYVTAPIALLKSIISLIHLGIACSNFAIIDVSERVTQRAAKSH